MQKTLVRKGQKINRNQVIGYVGRTGRTTGAHLHFETRIRGKATNPLVFLPYGTGKNAVVKGATIPSLQLQLEFYRLNNIARKISRSPS
jgi:hypothetical protein